MSEAYVWVARDKGFSQITQIFRSEPTPQWPHYKSFGGSPCFYAPEGIFNLAPGECRRFRLVEAPLTEGVQE